MSYQWFFASALVTGATNSTYSITNVQYSQAGTYFVIVSNSSGSTISSNAVLTVTNIPPAVTNDAYSLLLNSVLTVPVPGVLSNDTDANGDSLSVVLATNVAHGTLLLATNGSFTYTPATGYYGGDSFNYRALDGYTNSAVATVNLTVLAAPFITNPPASQLAAVGKTVALQVGAGGTSPLRYQWRFNGATVSKATNASLTVTNIQLTNAGDYSVVITNPVGAVTSAPATLTVYDPNLHLNQAWLTNYAGSASAADYLTASIVDAQGNVYVTGSAKEAASGSYDYVTLKYNAKGARLWRAVFDGNKGGGDDKPYALAVDAAGNVYVTGSSTSAHELDFTTVKYDSNGNQLWVALYDNLKNNDNVAASVAVDTNGNVFVTGYSVNAAGNNQFATLKYSSAGVPLWTNTYVGPANSEDEPVALALDADGNVFVTGQSKGSGSAFDFATLKYSNAGVPLWTNRFNGLANKEDMPTNLVVDAVGNVYVTGQSKGSGSGIDFATLKYSNAGTLLWSRIYDDPSGLDDIPSDLVVDSQGNVFVTGTSSAAAKGDYTTLKYDPAGTQLWVTNYDAGDDDRPAMLALDPAGDVYVTGRSRTSATGYDFATVKYDGTDGAQLAVARYNSSGSVNDYGLAVGVDANFNVYVSGQGLSPLDYVLLKYQPSYLRPAISAVSLSNLTATSVQFNALVNPAGDLTGGYFQYGLTTNYGATAAVMQILPGTNNVAVSAAAAGLLSAAVYHYQLMATNDAGVATSPDATFITLNLPVTLTTLAATGITTNGAVMNALINPQGTAAAYCFEFGPDTNYGQFTVTNLLPAGWSDVAVAAAINGLDYETVLHYRVVAVLPGGNIVGADATVTTLPLPGVFTLPATDVTINSATFNGIINPLVLGRLLGVTSYYWQYGTDTNYASKTATVVSGASANGTVVAKSVSGLTPGTLYHVALVGSGTTGKSYGDDATFVTPFPPPSVAPLPASDLTPNTATLNAIVNSEGTTASSYFQFGTTTNYGLFSATNALPADTNDVAVAAAVAALLPGTTYHYAVVAVSSGGTTISADAMFVTPWASPVVTTLAAANVTTTTAQLNASLNPQGTAASYYFSYGLTTNYDQFSVTNTVPADTNPLPVADLVAGLMPGTLYHYSVIAQGAGGSGSGADATFTTAYLPPVAATLAATDLTPSSATLNAAINPMGTAVQWCFQFGTTTNYGAFTDTNTLPAGTLNVTTSAGLTGLAPGTDYHYSVIAGSAGGVTTGADLTCTTPFPPPTTATLPASNLTTNSATLQAAINPQGAATAYYFQYGLTTNYDTVTPTNGLPAGTTAHPVGADITGLAPGTLYHYSVVAANAGGTSAGDDLTFTTAYLPPAVAGLAADSLTTNSATLHATVNPQGTPATCYFRFGATTNYGLFSTTNSLAAATSATAQAVAVTNLLAGTLYHCAVVAVGSGGTSVGADATFTTVYLPPAVATLTASNLTVNSALLSAAINPQGTTASYYFRYGTTTNYGLFSATNAVAAGTNAATKNVAVTNLQPGTLYHFAVTAVSSGGTNTSADAVFTTPFLPPGVTPQAASDVTAGSATLRALVNSHGTTAVCYFKYGTATNYGLFTATNSLAEATNDVLVAIPVAGLTPGTEYHFSLVAVSAGGTSTGADAAFTTLNLPPIQFTGSAQTPPGGGAGQMQLQISTVPGTTFTVLGTTNLQLPADQWPVIGTMIEIAPGQYQFTDTPAVTNRNFYYRIRSP